MPTSTETSRRHHVGFSNKRSPRHHVGFRPPELSTRSVAGSSDGGVADLHDLSAMQQIVLIIVEVLMVASGSRCLCGKRNTRIANPCSLIHSHCRLASISFSSAARPHRRRPTLLVLPHHHRCRTPRGSRIGFTSRLARRASTAAAGDGAGASSSLLMVRSLEAKHGSHTLFRSPIHFCPRGGG